MKFSFSISSFLALAMVLACATADDLAALKTTLQKLCNANENGAYGSCCASNNDGQDIASISGLSGCFGTVTASSSAIITKLFVPSSACTFG